MKPGVVRVIAVCVFRRGDAILAQEGRESQGAPITARWMPLEDFEREGSGLDLAPAPSSMRLLADIWLVRA